jgi:flavin-dependent dehydrogenase
VSRPAPGPSSAVVLGAGPAGASTALALCRAGLDVAMVDPGPPPGPRVGESLPPAVRAPLAELGLLESFQAAGHLPSRGTASDWGPGGPGFQDFLIEPLGHGWHLDRAVFDASLRHAAQEAGARQVTGRFTAASGGPEGWSVNCTGGLTLRADVVVDATGRGASFAAGRGAQRLVIDRLVGLAGIFDGAPDDGLRHRTLIETCPHGWWYAAPLPGQRTVLALMTDADLARTGRFTDPACWYQLLTRSHLLPVPAAPPPRLLVRAAGSQLLAPAAGPGWIAVGEAARCLDPLSSSGILTALQDGRDAGLLVAAGGLADAGALKDRDAELGARFTRYLADRHRLYRLEDRWPAPFWRRRGTGAPV